MADDALTLKEAAERVGIQSATLKRWSDTGVIPQVGRKGGPPPPSRTPGSPQRLRERGHTLGSDPHATADGRLAYGYIEDLFPVDAGRTPLKKVAEEIGLEPKLIERLWLSIGLPADELEQPDRRGRAGAALRLGRPRVGLSARRLAPADARLRPGARADRRRRGAAVPHLRARAADAQGIPGLQIAEEMEHLARDLLPLASPIMDYVHQRFLQHFVEQDMIGHMETELDGAGAAELGRIRVAIAFADLAGYTRFTEEEGEEEALSFVERFVEAVTETLPDDARIIKTIGDEVMIVGSDPAALTDWAVGFQRLWTERPTARIGIHTGVDALSRRRLLTGAMSTLPRGSSPVARGGEVLVTDAVSECDRPQRPPHVRGASARSS